MIKLKPTEQQSMTAHIIRASKTDFRVWLGMREIKPKPVAPITTSTAARKLALHTLASELVECWPSGKTYERTPRGAWKAVGKN